MNEDLQLADAYLLRRQGAAQDDALSWLKRGTPAPMPHNPPAQEKPEESGALETAGKVARDVGKGLVEAPGAVVRGATNAINEAIDIADSLGQWVEDATGLGGLEFSTSGIRTLSAEELQAKRAAGEDVATNMRVPQMDWTQSESVTGGLVEGVAQFLTGFGAASKLLKGTKVAAGLGQWGTSMAAGAMADATVFDEHANRLSNLVEEFPELRNPVTEYLKADPTDSMAEGRLKNALEGLGLGVVTHGLGLALKSMRTHLQGRATDAADAVLGKKRAAAASLDDLEVEVRTLDPDGNMGKAKMPAGQAIKDLDDGITTMRAILECLG